MKSRSTAIVIVTLLWCGALPVIADSDPMQEVEHLRLSGDQKKEVELLEQLVHGSHEKDPVAQLYYAQCLRSQNRTDEAREHLRRVLSLSNAWPAQTAHNMLIDMEPVSVQSSRTKGGLKGYIGILFYKGMVIDVVPDSPAQRANIAKGDKLISANGASLLRLNDDVINQYLAGYVGSSVDLVIERGGKRYACKLIRGHAERSAGRPTRITDATAAAVAPAPRTVQTAKENGKLQSKVSSIVPISFRRHTSESDAVQSDVVAALAIISKPLLEEVAADGIKVVITPTMPDALNNSSGERPRGYIHGGGYDNCPAMFSPRDKSIYIAERASRGNAPMQRNVWVAGSLFHEFGHALDNKRKISGSADFASVYKADCDRLPNGARTHYYYYTQTGEAGPSELFAELFAHALSRKGQTAIEDPNMPEAFPRSYAFILKNIES